jgi:hypothetical protein
MRVGEDLTMPGAYSYKTFYAVIYNSVVAHALVTAILNLTKRFYSPARGVRYEIEMR